MQIVYKRLLFAQNIPIKLLQQSRQCLPHLFFAHKIHTVDYRPLFPASVPYGRLVTLAPEYTRLIHILVLAPTQNDLVLSPDKLLLECEPRFFARIYKNAGAKLLIKGKTGFVFQNFNLYGNKTALGNVTLGLTVAQKMPKEEAEKLKAELEEAGATVELK